MKYASKMLAMLCVSLLVAATAQASTYSTYVGNQTNLIAYYQFEEQSGTTVDNAEGTAGYDGTTDIPLPADSIAGARTADGWGGLGTTNNAFDFGATANTEVTLTTALATACDDSSLTFSAMIKLNSTSNNTWIFDTGTSITNSITIHRWNQLLYVGVNGGQTKTYSSSSINDLKWHHLTVVRDGTTSADVALYVDGVAITQGAGGNTTHNSGLPTIGALAGGGDLWFNGGLDEVALFSDAMTSTEVTSLYNKAVPEPATMSLLGIGGLLALVRRRRK